MCLSARMVLLDCRRLHLAPPNPMVSTPFLGSSGLLATAFAPPCHRHFTETTARPLHPHPRHWSRSLRSSDLNVAAQAGPQQDLRRQQRDVGLDQITEDAIPI
jgi:hypothetical protein